MAEEEKAETPQSGRTQLLMRIGGGIALLLAGTGGGWFAKGFFSPAATPDAAETASADGKTEAKAEDGKAEAKPEEGKTEAKPEEGKTEAKPEEGKTEGKPEEGKTEAKAEGGGTEVPPAADANGKVITNLKTFVVNLRSSGGGRVLRMEVQVESDRDVAPSLELATPKLRDTILTAVSDYTFAELEGTDGKTRLRDELLTRINGAIAPLTVNQVYFTQFVVQ
jgi:flagellar basal body-associated protein FliL